MKERPVLTRSHFMWQYEPCWYGWKQGQPPKRKPPSNQTNVWTISQKGQLDGIHPCLHPDSLVLTAAGYRAIQTIQVGDRVYAADGTFRAVTHVSSHPYQSPELYRIVAKGGNVDTLASDNHPFLVWRPERQGDRIVSGTVRWLRADELEVGDYTMTPALAEIGSDPSPEKDEEYWFLFGLYLATGHVQKAGHGECGYPAFSLPKKEEALIGRIRTKWGRLGVYDPSDYGALRSQRVSVVAFDGEVGAEFEALGGSGTGAKHIVPSVLELPRAKRLAVLRGWLAGDGCRVHGRTYWQAKTVSPDLAAQLALLGESVGYKVNVFSYEPPAVLGQIQGRTLQSQSTVYQLYFYERDGSLNTRPGWLTYEGHTYTLRYVKKVERVPYTGDVWNLSVEGCPTFQTAVGMSHNTQKPTEIFERPISWHTAPGDLVYEPFCGSGSQLIAAAKLGRRCLAMELAPEFVDVIRRRWTKFARSAGVKPGKGGLE